MLKNTLIFLGISLLYFTIVTVFDQNQLMLGFYMIASMLYALAVELIFEPESRAQMQQLLDNPPGMF